jgi:hypothetical protein
MEEKYEEEEEEGEGLQGVFKQLRRNSHQLGNGTSKGSARAVTQVRPNPGKVASVCK